MPRDGSGNYTAPGNPQTPGTTILSDWANTLMDDLETELTDSLSRSGKGGMLSVFGFADGLVNNPGIQWINEPTTGFWRSGAGDTQFSLLGVPLLRFNSSDIFKWDGASWRELVDTTDLIADGTVTGQILEWNGVSGAWEAGTHSRVALARNVGTGIGFWKDYDGDYIQFKSLTSSDGTIDITSTTNTLNVGVEASAFAGSNLGASGEGVFSAVDFTGGVFTYEFKKLIGGDNVSLVADANSITIDSPAGAAGEVNTGSSLGTGADVYKQKVGADLQFRSITTARGVVATENTNDIQLALPTGTTNHYLRYDGTNWVSDDTFRVNSSGHYSLGGVTISASSNAVVASPNDEVWLGGTTDATKGIVVNTTGSAPIIRPASQSNPFAYNNSMRFDGDDHRWFRGASERMRLTSSGTFNIGGSLSSTANTLGVVHSAGSTNAFQCVDSSATVESFAVRDNAIRMSSTSLPVQSGTDVHAVSTSGAWNLRRSSSSIRYKENVVDLDIGLEELKQLRPVSFNFKEQGGSNAGLIAEEVVVLPDFARFVNHNEDGDVESVRYSELVGVLIKAIQQLTARVEALEG